MTLPASTGALPGRPVRVMIVDDSAVVRGLVSRWIESEPGIEVVAYATDGLQAIKKARETEIDVCVLDIEMPNMSGLEALPDLLAARPGLKVIMASTLTTRGAQVTLRALDLGAADFMPKPEANRIGGADSYRVELVEKIRFLGRAAARVAAPRPAIVAPVRAPAVPALASPTPNAEPRHRRIRPEILVVASSTGGPPALRQLLLGLGTGWRTPIVIAQHMPANFTEILAQHLEKTTSWKVKEAVDGELLRDGTAYIAPGGFHLTLVREPVGVRAKLDQGPEENFCRPSADPLFRSAAAAYGSGVQAVVLTGMGHDGREGARVIVQSGGDVIAQDEASSVVWGMPGAVVEQGLASDVLPLDAIGPQLVKILNGVA